MAVIILIRNISIRGPLKPQQSNVTSEHRILKLNLIGLKNTEFKNSLYFVESEFFYRVQKILLLFAILSLANPVIIMLKCFYKIYFKIILHCDLKILKRKLVRVLLCFRWGKYYRFSWSVRTGLELA